ncbi:MAG: HAD family hydrolase [Candidatus Riflebacteria bacterium]|nr:HAD family hydrolase [Candidatus Riflebacteria bacterium]
MRRFHAANALLALLVLSGATWAEIRASCPPGPMSDVVDRVRAVRREKQIPVVIFDLDDTLYRVSYRTKRIFVDWAARLPAQHDPMKASIAALDPEKMPYHLATIMDMGGIKGQELRSSALRRWSLFFFSNRYLGQDQPLPGSVAYVDLLVRSGATIVYLTGRNTRNMEAGTILSLRRAGFPVPGPGVRLMMKPTRRVDDLDFKRQTVGEIARLGTVVGGFDNEPANVNLFREAFPGAIAVFVDTVHSDDPPPLMGGVVTIKDYSPGHWK